MSKKDIFYWSTKILITKLLRTLNSGFPVFLPIHTPLSVMASEEDDYDYESLGSNTTMTQNAIAGALAGIAEHCAMYPVDSIKVGVFAAYKKLYKLNENIRLACKLLILQHQLQ